MLAGSDGAVRNGCHFAGMDLARGEDRTSVVVARVAKDGTVVVLEVVPYPREAFLRALLMKPLDKEEPR